MAAALSFRYGHQTIQYQEDNDCYSCNTGVTTVKMSNVSEERRQELSIMNEQLDEAKQCMEDLVNSVTPSGVTRLCVHCLLATDPGTPDDVLEWARQHLRGLIINDDDAGTRLKRLNDAIALMEHSSGELNDQLVEWYNDTLGPRRTSAIGVVSLVPGQEHNNSPNSSLTGPTGGDNVAAAAPVVGGALMAPIFGFVQEILFLFSSFLLSIFPMLEHAGLPHRVAAPAAAAEAGNQDNVAAAAQPVVAGVDNAGLPGVAAAAAAEAGNRDDGGRNPVAAGLPGVAAAAAAEAGNRDVGGRNPAAAGLPGVAAAAAAAAEAGNRDDGGRNPAAAPPAAVAAGGNAVGDEGSGSSLEFTA